jgi:hypothetical protein
MREKDKRQKTKDKRQKTKDKRQKTKDKSKKVKISNYKKQDQQSTISNKQLTTRIINRNEQAYQKY